MKPRKSAGAALVLALLIVSLVGGLSTEMTGEHLLNIKYQKNYLDEEQSYFYLLAAENFARRVLLEDQFADDRRYKLSFESDQKWADNLCEPWLRAVSYPIDGGSIRIEMTDLNRRFNLNRLLINDLNRADSFPRTRDQMRFVRLLQTFEDLQIDTERAIEIAEAVYDWMDPNQEREGFGGMEEGDYAAAGFNYRPSNLGLNSLSELRLIPAVSPQLYRRLREHVTVWPSYGRMIAGNRGRDNNRGAVNINTATPNVLRAMGNIYGLLPMPPEEIRDQRTIQYTSYVPRSAGVTAVTRGGEFISPSCGYRNKSQFLRSPFSVEQHLVTLQSNQILVRSTVTLGNVSRRVESVLHRIKGKAEVQVWARAFGGL